MLCSRNLLGIPLRKLGEDVKRTNSSLLLPTAAKREFVRGSASIAKSLSFSLFADSFASHLK